MSHKQLHDLLVQLESEYSSVEMIEHEHKAKLDAIIESLEQQKIYPENFDQFSTLQSLAGEMAMEYEERFPKLSTILKSISQTLENFVR